MYLPDHFGEARTDELLALIAAYPLGALVVNGPDGLDANHLPFLVDEASGGAKLLAHVARSNPVWEQAADGTQVLIIFRADDAYISPNWYPSKHESHRQVPTWNYRVVHVHGRLHVRDDERFVRGVVARRTRTHERRAESPKPWKMSESPREFTDQMIANIVGIEVEIDRLVGKWKLSQNKEARDRSSAADELEARGEDGIAGAMRETTGGDR
jgi:transcriptional regulator